MDSLVNWTYKTGSDTHLDWDMGIYIRVYYKVLGKQLQ